MKKALVIGIDDYPDAELTGCVADATAMARILERNDDGSRNYEVRLRTSESHEIDRPFLRMLLAELFENPRDDELLLYFSGHGAQTPWGADLVTQDYAEHSLGVAMDDVLTLATTSAAREVLIILDCCFSGQVGNLAAIQGAGVDPQFRFGRALIRENVTFMAASHELEAAVEIGGQGAFTRLLIDGLEGAAADQLGHVTALSLYVFASRGFGGWEQRPVFKSNITQPAVLRQCTPFIESNLLRRLPDHFERANARVRLDPEYEGDGRPLKTGEGTPKQQAYDYFRKLRNASLLATDANEDLYFVVLGSGEVFLTPLGRYFWGLASEDRL